MCLLLFIRSLIYDENNSFRGFLIVHIVKSYYGCYNVYRRILDALEKQDQRLFGKATGRCVIFAPFRRPTRKSDFQNSNDTTHNIDRMCYYCVLRFP